MVQKEINCFYTSSRKYSRYLYVSVYSLFMNHLDYHLRVYVASFDLADEDMKDLKLLADEFHNEVYLLKADIRKYQEMLVRYGKKELFDSFGQDGIWGLYYFMFDLLPLDVTRVVRLHADTVLRGGLGEVYEEDMRGACINCIDFSFDGSADAAERVNSTMERIGCRQYCMESFFVCDMDAVRKEDINAETLISAEGLTRKEWCLLDPILTKAFDGKIIHCSGLKYNYYSMETIKIKVSKEELARCRRESIVVHYDGFKPWNVADGNMWFNSLWWEYAKHTLYYDSFREAYLDETKQKERGSVYRNKKAFLRNRLYYAGLAAVITGGVCWVIGKAGGRFAASSLAIVLFILLTVCGLRDRKR